ncbi:type VII secretion target [Actinosynnema sp. NPDC020468]|uniref:type VII secretion target n=1 Tax=Actinosynnema sp. NPDC020468 TaxID=3154488 RepID=UPI0033D60715
MAKGFGVDTAALAQYGSTASGLAAEVGTVGTSTLSGVDALSAGSFGKLGDEVGLGAAFRKAAKAQVDGVAAAAKGLAGFASEVSKTGAAYTEQEQQHGDSLQRTYQV